MADPLAPNPTSPALPEALRAQLVRSGYYPDLMADVVATAVGEEPVEAHLVHAETTFDTESLRRHATVLVLTASRLVVAHADEHPPEEGSGTPGETWATASTEAVARDRITSVVLSHVVARPHEHRTGTPPVELSLTIGWGAMSRVDLEPASCADPDCDADHGYTGTITSDDVVVRVSAAAEGRAAVDDAVAFARALSSAPRR